jgi:hypothetical protein
VTFHDLARRGTHLLSNNSPAILTAIGVTGTITTAYLTGKASFKAADILAYENEGRQLHKDPTGLRSSIEPVSPREAIDLVWKIYIPAIGTGVMTITCIVLANRIGMRRAAAVAAAFSVSEKAIAEYKDKVVEHIGKNKEQKVRDEIAQDRINANPVSSQQVIVTGGGDVLCYETYTGRYFTSSMEQLKKAQNDVNHMIINSFYASLDDFYDKIGLGHTKVSSEVGWNADELLELHISTAMSDDERPCLSVDFRVEPIRNFHRVH